MAWGRNTVRDDRGHRAGLAQGSTARTRLRGASVVGLTLALLAGGSTVLGGAAQAQPDSGIASARTVQAGRLTITKGVNYGPAKLDIYQVNDGVRNKPLIILIHGGGWTGGSRKESSVVTPTKDFAKHGYVALSIDYPLANETTAGNPMEQNAIIAAADWAIAHRSDLGIDKTRIATIGGSSGGHLSLLAGEQANAASPGKIKISLAMSGPVDLWGPVHDAQVNPPGQVTPVMHNIEIYLGCEYADCTEAQAKSGSPLFEIEPSCPKIYLARAEDEGISGGEDYVDALAAQGCSGTFHVVAGTDHGFHYWDRIRDDVFRYMKANM